MRRRVVGSNKLSLTAPRGRHRGHDQNCKLIAHRRAKRRTPPAEARGVSDRRDGRNTAHIGRIEATCLTCPRAVMFHAVETAAGPYPVAIRTHSGC